MNSQDDDPDQDGTYFLDGVQQDNIVTDIIDNGLDNGGYMSDTGGSDEDDPVDHMDADLDPEPANLREQYAQLINDTETPPGAVKRFLIVRLQGITEKWLMDPDQVTVNFITLLSKACENFNVPADSMPAIEWEEIDILKLSHLQEINYLIGLFYFNSILLTPEQERVAGIEARDESRYYKNVFERITMSIDQSLKILGSLDTMVMASTPSYQVSGKIGIIEFHNESPELKPMQKLIQFILQNLYSRNLRRKGDLVYQPIVTPPDANGKTYVTRSYKLLGSIEKFVYSCLDRSVEYDQFLNATDGPSVIPTCIRFVTNCEDVQFPTLKTNRNAISFLNGIYLTHVRSDTGEYSDLFIEYSSVTTSNYILDTVLKPGEASCRYIPLNMSVTASDIDWDDIQTPLFSSIIDRQWTTDQSVIDSDPTRSEENVAENRDIKTMLYCFMGRLLYDLKTLDNWEKMLFLLGRPGCGKSTLVDIISKVYEKIDVGTISTKIEAGFGLSSLTDKLLLAGPEIKKDCQLDSADLQSMISGEAMTVRIKQKTAVSMHWKTPVIMAGNAVPSPWQEAMVRRVVAVVFSHSLDDDQRDPGLAEKILKHELPSIIRKINLAYLNIVNELAGRHVDIYLNQIGAFRRYSDSIARNTNPLYEFLFDNDHVLYRGSVNDIPDCTIAYHKNRSVTKLEVMNFYKAWAAIHGDSMRACDMQSAFNEHNLPATLERISIIKNLGYRIRVIGGWIHGFDFKPSTPAPTVSCADTFAKSTGPEPSKTTNFYGPAPTPTKRQRNAGQSGGVWGNPGIVFGGGSSIVDSPGSDVGGIVEYSR